MPAPTYPAFILFLARLYGAILAAILLCYPIPLMLLPFGINIAGDATRILLGWLLLGWVLLLLASSIAMLRRGRDG